SISRIGVVGAGRMGVGIVLVFASRGMDVRLAEESAEALTTALATLREQAARMASRGRAPSAEAVMERIVVSSLAEMADRDLVVEAITEDMDAKKALFATLSGVVAPDAILATNTSYLDVNRIADAATHPERVAGLHFFNPAHFMK